MTENQERFWTLAMPHLEAARVVRGTMMGTPCLRRGKDFVAMVGKGRFDGLIVKLPREAVVAHIDAGRGQAFAPNGKVFKQWLHLPTYDQAAWDAMLAEAVGL